MDTTRRQRLETVGARLRELRNELEAIRREEQEVYEKLISGASGQCRTSVTLAGAAYSVGRAEENIVEILSAVPSVTE